VLLVPIHCWASVSKEVQSSSCRRKTYYGGLAPEGTIGPVVVGVGDLTPLRLGLPVPPSLA